MNAKLTNLSSISQDDIRKIKTNFLKDKNNLLLMNTINNVGIEKASLNREVVNKADHLFNHKVDDWEVMDQKQSGRCWIFAAMNLYKPQLCKKLNIQDIHLSANYIQFWDFFEKANLFFINLQKTCDKPLDDRLVQNILNVAPEGGFWDMFIALVNKYGIVPDQVMPDTVDAEKTVLLSRILASYLRSQAKEIRHLAKQGTCSKKFKQEYLNTVYRIIAMHLGLPPEKFDFVYENKDKKVKNLKDCTPLQFAADLEKQDSVTLINDPREERPFMKHYTSEYVGSVEGELMDFLNVDITTMKSMVKKMIDKGRIVWMSCDVHKMANHENGVFNDDAYNYCELLSIPKPLSKADRLNYCDGGGNHAMLFTGYHEEGGIVTKWRIENSWGDKKGEKGYYELSDKWFDEHVYTSLISKDLLGKDLLAVLEEPFVKLMPWELPY